jgi:hypothetical protein
MTSGAMNAMLRLLFSPLVLPSLGFGALAIPLIYASFFIAAALLRPDFRPLILLPFIPLFWVSLRVLLRVGKPPETLRGGIAFALMLLNFVFGLIGILVLMFALASEL